MNRKLLLVSFSIITLASCSTAYKTGQTPDDVYYSPAREYGEETSEDKKEENGGNRDYTEERQIRMSAYDRRWRYLDNDIYYSPYYYGYNYGYYYNPFYSSYPVYSTCACACLPTNPKTSTPRMTNLSAYNNSSYNNINNNSPVASKYGTTRPPSPTRGYNNSNKNNGSKLGNTLNKIFNNGNSSNNSNDNSSSGNRTYSPSSSSSSSQSSSSSSGGTSRPARSGKN